ncbi:MAG: 50S ribosomal protein L15 [Desulfovibrio sp.]|nr:MAG: 50S ribosomal protein L15 [Desulfovibrio sp.]
MNLHELHPFAEERKQRKRVGRGSATGWGCTCGKGNKGQNCRSGGGVRPGFEGGQMPLARRLPKRGFTNIFKVSYTPVNLERLAKTFEGKSEVTLDDIYASGLVKQGALVKILGQGEIGAMTIEAHRFSKSAEDKILAAGGQFKALEG